MAAQGQHNCRVGTTLLAERGVVQDSETPLWNTSFRSTDLEGSLSLIGVVAKCFYSGSLGYLSMNTKMLPDWAEAATVVLEACLPEIVVALLLQEVEQKRLLLENRDRRFRSRGARSERSDFYQTFSDRQACPPALKWSHHAHQETESATTGSQITKASNSRGNT